MENVIGLDIRGEFLEEQKTEIEQVCRDVLDEIMDTLNESTKKYGEKLLKENIWVFNLIKYNSDFKDILKSEVIVKKLIKFDVWDIRNLAVVANDTGLYEMLLKMPSKEEK